MDPVEIEDEDLFYKAITEEELTILVDSLFFPDWSSLVAAHFIITYKNMKIGSRNFISTVVPLYRNLFTAELCWVLAVLKCLEYFILK